MLQIQRLNEETQEISLPTQTGGVGRGGFNNTKQHRGGLVTRVKFFWNCAATTPISQSSQTYIYIFLKNVWMTVQAAFISKLPHSKSIKRLRSPCQKGYWDVTDTSKEGCQLDSLTLSWSGARLIKVIVFGTSTTSFRLNFRIAVTQWLSSPFQCFLSSLYCLLSTCPMAKT